MTDFIFTDWHEFLRLYRRLYSFLRQAWEREKVLYLKEILQKSLAQANENREEAFYARVLEMRTALITIDEIGLKQPTVCAVLLFRPVRNEEYTLAEAKKLFGDEVELILRGLKKVGEFTDRRSTWNLRIIWPVALDGRGYPGGLYYDCAAAAADARRKRFGPFTAA